MEERFLRGPGNCLVLSGTANKEASYLTCVPSQGFYNLATGWQCRRTHSAASTSSSLQFRHIGTSGILPVFAVTTGTCCGALCVHAVGRVTGSPSFLETCAELQACILVVKVTASVSTHVTCRRHLGLGYPILCITINAITVHRILILSQLF
mgnify:CR=1 FL=1